MRVSEKSKIFYLIILILFSIAGGIFMMDYIDLIDVSKFYSNLKGSEPEMSIYADDDEPSLIALEEFEKQKEQLQQRIEELDKRQAILEEQEKELSSELEKIDEMRNGIELEKKKLVTEKNKDSGYNLNVMDLANKIVSMPPESSVEIMVKWDDPLIIDVIRQMDKNAADAGTQSITSYLLSLMPKERASRIMDLMTRGI